MSDDVGVILAKLTYGVATIQYVCEYLKKHNIRTYIDKEQKECQK